MPIDPAELPPDDFADTVLGAISWSKAIGRPDTPRLADGFSILMLGTDVVGTGPGGPVFHPVVPLTPKVRDGEGGADNWRVEFSLNGLKSVEGLTKQALILGAIDPAKKDEIDRLATYTVKIHLNSGVNWTAAKPLAIAPVRVDPQELSFLKHDGTLSLPDFGITDTFA